MTHSSVAAHLPAAWVAERRTDQQWLLCGLLAIFLLELALVLGLLPTFQRHFSALMDVGRVDNYNALAKNIIAGSGYRFTPTTALTLLREPGYPYFLAALSYVSDGSVRAAIIANLLLATVSALLLSRLARHMSRDRWVPLIAPAVLLLHPGIVVAELRSGVEILFTLLLLCFFLLLRRALQSERLAAYAAAGAMLGLACMVRSTPLLFPGFLLLYHIARKPGWDALRRSAAGVALMSGAALLVLAPWGLRNYMLVHRFVVTASVQGVSEQVGLYQCTQADSGKNFGELDQAAAATRNSLAAAQGYRFVPGYYQYFYSPTDELKFNDFLGRQALATYRHAPALLFKCGAENLLNVWFRGRSALVTLGICCVQLPFLLLAVLGLRTGWASTERSTLICLLLFVGYSMAVCVPIHAEARYGIPLIPILALLGACRIAAWLQQRRSSGAQTRLDMQPVGT
ncbi:MAG TPA: glycosyltransferase family 39 protein [Steroidobacteraceae bacterium]